MAEEPPSEIPLESAKNIVESPGDNFPEFENYEIFCGKTKVEKNPGKLVNAFRYVGNGLGNMTSFVQQKYQDYEINSKIKTGGKATLNGLSKAGNYLYDLSLPFMKYASNKASQGVGYLYSKISGNTENGNNEKNTINEEGDTVQEDNIILQEKEDEIELEDGIEKKNENEPKTKDRNNDNNKLNEESNKDQKNNIISEKEDNKNEIENVIELVNDKDSDN